MGLIYIRRLLIIKELIEIFRNIKILQKNYVRNVKM
jgi:hypothetical protein